MSHAILAALMFRVQDFNAELLRDNPTYERVLRSDLHDVVTLVRRNGFTVQQLAAEMKKVSAAKWQKYQRTRAYLVREFPLLPNMLRGSLINFKTQSLTKGGAGAIVHVLMWESDTGNLGDLAHMRVRERVAWPAPLGEAVNHVIPEYRVQGVHYGQGNAAFTPGNLGRGDDTHAALGPFAPTVLSYAGPAALQFVINQTYEMSDNNGATWQTIPNSGYTITRQVSKAGPRTRLSIVKTNLTKPGDTCTNFTEV